MKRLILVAVALSALSAPAMAAPFNNHNQTHQAEQQKPDAHHNSWRKGSRVPSAQRHHVIDYKRAHLKAPGRGQQWVQVDNQYLLINISSGVISTIFGLR